MFFERGTAREYFNGKHPESENIRRSRLDNSIGRVNDLRSEPSFVSNDWKSSSEVRIDIKVGQAITCQPNLTGATDENVYLTGAESEAMLSIRDDGLPLLGFRVQCQASEGIPRPQQLVAATGRRQKADQGVVSCAEGRDSTKASRGVFGCNLVYCKILPFSSQP